MSTPYLSRPSIRYRESFLAALRETHAEGRRMYWEYDDAAADFPVFVRSLLDREYNPPSKRAPESCYWLVKGRDYIGTVSVRHRLNDSLREFGGHIGYEIRPTLRRRGYGTLICKLGLEKARQLGIKRVLITCDDNNIASARIIEANGGVLQDVRLLDWRYVPTRRYWVEIE
jgi:predicted acetyltransferase